MLTNISEMLQALKMIDQIKAELEVKQIRYDKHMQIGGMIEVPAAAVCADTFSKHLDFLSIGTNDLIQYTMAIDRGNDEVNYLYDPLHPAVLRLIQTALKAGEKADIPVAMCGEMAGQPEFTRLLLGLGLREFSVHPTILLEIKQIINQSKLTPLMKLAKKALKAETGSEVAEIMSAV